VRAGLWRVGSAFSPSRTLHACAPRLRSTLRPTRARSRQPCTSSRGEHRMPGPKPGSLCEGAVGRVRWPRLRFARALKRLAAGCGCLAQAAWGPLTPPRPSSPPPGGRGELPPHPSVPSPPRARGRERARVGSWGPPLVGSPAPVGVGAGRPRGLGVGAGDPPPRGPKRGEASLARGSRPAGPASRGPCGPRCK